MHADKASVGVVWDREDYIKQAQKKLGDKEVYEEIFNDSQNTVIAVIVKIKKTGWSKKG